MPQQNLQEAFREAVAAAFGGIWIKTHEPFDAVREIGAVIRANVAEGWSLLLWDPEKGLVDPAVQNERAPTAPCTPGAALAELEKRNRDQGEDSSAHAILVLRNFHYHLYNPQGWVTNTTLLQQLQRVIEEGAAQGRHVVIMASEETKILPELEKMFYVIEHALPGPDELWNLLSTVLPPDDLPDRKSSEAQILLESAAGLSRIEALGAYSLSLARNNKIEPKVMWELKANMLTKSGLLELYEVNDSFNMLGGLNNLKEFCIKSINSPNRDDRTRARGVALLGIQGGGKTQFAKVLGHEVGRPTVRLDPGALMGGIVGTTEANVRKALNIIDAMAPCILVIDEVEKALAGTGGESHDSGVGARMLGSLLTWLNDHTSDVYPIVTSNNISLLPPEFTRAERFDGIFFVDLPLPEQVAEIWKIYIDYFRLTPDQADKLPACEEWTGAEIRACCRLARLHDITLVESAKQIVPVAVTARERLDALREWAHHRCLSADYRGIYDRNGEHKMMPASEIGRPVLRRRVTRAAK